MKGLPFGVGQFPFKPWLHPLLARHETHTRVSSPCYDIEGGEPGARLKFLIVSCRSLHSLMLAILTQLPPSPDALEQLHYASNTPIYFTSITDHLLMTLIA